MWYLFIVIGLLFSCSSDTNDITKENVLIVSEGITAISYVESQIEKLTVDKEDCEDPLEQIIIRAGLVDVQEIDTTILVDLKYNSSDNFMGFKLYECLKKAYLQTDVALRLAKSNAALKEKDSMLRLIIFDAVRPVSVQQLMWDALDSIPVKERVKFVSNPKNRSLHNLGAAVDVSIFDLKSDTLLDMGAGFDDIRKIAYPKYEDSFLSLGVLSQHQVDNRRLLRAVMRKGGFWVLETEWWHFNAYTRSKALELFEVIE